MIYFCLSNILKVVLNNFQNNAQTKIDRSDSDSPRRIPWFQAEIEKISFASQSQKKSKKFKSLSQKKQQKSSKVRVKKCQKKSKVTVRQKGKKMQARVRQKRQNKKFAKLELGLQKNKVREVRVRFAKKQSQQSSLTFKHV